LKKRGLHDPSYSCGGAAPAWAYFGDIMRGGEGLEKVVMLGMING